MLAALTGRTLGNYRVLDKIGQGGMGAVYLGEHVLIGRKVAIKVLLPEVASDQSRLKRFFNEARASAQVRHPSIVDVLDFGTQEGTSYLVMEYLEGETVRSRVKRTGALPETSVRRLGRQVASALAAAHAGQIIHRDLKPDNLFLVRDEDVIGKERIKVLDFGIAKLLADSGDGSVDTGRGTILGSLGYMAPEQASGEGVTDERTDVYALGCVLFEMSCARRPFTASGFAGVLSMQMFSPAPSPRQHAPDISADLEAIITRMLARHPADRFASMSDVVAALDDGADAGPGAGRPTTPAKANASSPLQAGLLSDGLFSDSATHTAPPRSGPRRRRLAPFSIAALSAIVGAAVVFLVRPGGDGDRPATPAPAAPGHADRPSSTPAIASPQRDPAPSVPDAGPAPRPDAATAPPPSPAPRRAPRKRPSRPKVERGQVIDD
jgi:serine/threonine protein kinase